jgi:taurine dioxygenase
MKLDQIELSPLTGSSLGGVIDVTGNEEGFFLSIEGERFLAGCLDEADGLLLIRGLDSIRDQPQRLVDLSYQFGSEVENYQNTPTPANMIHESQAEILVISNRPPCDRQPPPQPDPPVTEAGTLPVQFPHRTGWHTDQSFRRPPPDVSLFYAVTTPPHGQGQTLFADGYAAYQGLSREEKNEIQGINGLHALLGTGRTEQAVRQGVEPMPLLEHQESQLQPLVRIHPVTRRPALYLCEYGQMDWLDGPIDGMEAGPDGAGSELLHRLMSHCTDPRFTYIHEWNNADLVVYDNRCLLHCATWFDADRYDRLMWRTTVVGNPGLEYAGERRSWIPRAGDDYLEGLGDGRWENLTRG